MLWVFVFCRSTNFIIKTSQHLTPWLSESINLIKSRGQKNWHQFIVHTLQLVKFNPSFMQVL